MTTSPARGFFSLLTVLLLALTAATGLRADDSDMGQKAFTLEVPDGKLSTKEVHDVVVAASTGRGWSVKSDATERVVIYINKHGHESTVTYLISDKEIEAYCVGYKVDGNGTRKAPEVYKSWLNNLSKDLTQALAKAALQEKK